MQRRIRFVLYLLFLSSLAVNGASWERLYSMRSTDCFRNVREVPNGDFVLAGYTANFNSHDTDAIVIRMEDNGDTIWTYKYNGPNNKEDCFYKVLPTSDGGFVACGYSRSFNGSDNALYLKLSSSGHLQWVKNWGGGGIDRAQDIIELPNGDFVIVGYTTSSPAHYYDAFILKINDNGTTQWSKIYGWNDYDDANSVKLLPDGGFIMGGQSDSDMLLIRTDEDGDSLWTRVWGTSSTENIECIHYAHGGGFIIAGHTDGLGNGDDDGYVIVTDTGGVEIWSETFGTNDKDDIHSIEPTSDGGYIASGTSMGGAWGDPNIWLLKMDDSGNQDWQKFFGGDEHDHGYSAIETADGGYLVVGHTHSFADDAYNEDALAVKTNSSGSVSNKLNYTTVTNLVSPISGVCGSANTQVKVEITNYGEATLSSIPVIVEITGAITQTLSQTYIGSIDRNETKSLTFNTTVDLSGGGTFYFHCYTDGDHDVIPERNYLDETITVNLSTGPPSVTDGTRCGPGSVALSASSSSTIRWFLSPTGGSSLQSGGLFNTPYISLTKTYYAEAGTTCLSSRVPVVATISGGLNTPITSNQARCGNGTLQLNAFSTDNIVWYASAGTLSILHSGSTFTTPALSSNVSYFVAAESSTCTSPRVQVDVTINAMPVVTLGPDTISIASGSIDLDPGSGFNAYSWSNSATSQMITVNSEGLYCVTVVDSNNCSANDCVYVQFSVGIAEESSHEFLIAPNPSSGVVYLKNATSEKLSLNVYSIDGRLLDKQIVFEDNTILDYSHLPKGYYIVRLSREEKQYTRSLILN